MTPTAPPLRDPVPTPLGNGEYALQGRRGWHFGRDPAALARAVRTIDGE